MPLVLEPPPGRDVREDSLPGDGGLPPGDGGFDGFGGGGGDDDDAGDGAWGGENPDSQGPWVTLATFWHPAEAHIARLRLEAGGVTCVLLDELTAATHVFAIAVGGVKLQVPPAQWRLASRLLREHRRHPTAAEAAEPANVRLASFAHLGEAKAAACVVEAANLECQVIEHGETAVPSWGLLLPRAWRGRLWPAASLAVERCALSGAAQALRRTPFGIGLTWTARRGRCDTCCADARWATWQLDWSAASGEAPTRRAVISRLPRLIRRCGRCGQAWGPAPERR